MAQGGRKSKFRPFVPQNLTPHVESAEIFGRIEDFLGLTPDVALEAVADGGQKQLDRRSGPLRDKLDGPIREISNEPPHRMVPGDLGGRLSKTDSLNASGVHDAAGDLGRRVVGL